MIPIIVDPPKVLHMTMALNLTSMVPLHIVSLLSNIYFVLGAVIMVH